MAEWRTEDVRRRFMIQARNDHGWTHGDEASQAAAEKEGSAFDEWLAACEVEAKIESLREARRVITQYLASAEKWRYDRVCWAFAIMLGEIPEDTPCPEAGS